jgi:hypothetical protein
LFCETSPEDSEDRIVNMPFWSLAGKAVLAGKAGGAHYRATPG